MLESSVLVRDVRESFRVKDMNGSMNKESVDEDETGCCQLGTLLMSISNPIPNMRSLKSSVPTRGRIS